MLKKNTAFVSSILRRKRSTKMFAFVGRFMKVGVLGPLMACWFFWTKQQI